MQVKYQFLGTNSSKILEKQQIFTLEQIHSDQIIHLTKENIWKNISPKGDAIITQIPNAIIAVKTADCIPILIFNQSNTIVAAIHAGRIGAFLDITTKTIQKINTILNNKNEQLYAIIGPCIWAMNYEVGSEIFLQWTKKQPSNKKYFYQDNQLNSIDKYLLNLPLKIYDQLINAGIKSENITQIPIDTFSNLQYCSYRRNMQDQERNLSIIYLE